MSKHRFFATLKFARQMITKDKALKQLLIRDFHYAYTCGWQDRDSVIHNKSGVA